MAALVSRESPYPVLTGAFLFTREVHRHNVLGALLKLSRWQDSNRRLTQTNDQSAGLNATLAENIQTSQSCIFYLTGVDAFP
jgi:hypothetical protein